MRRGALIITAAAALLAAPAVRAEDAPVSPPHRTDDIVVYGRAIEQVGLAGSASEGVVGYADFEDRPIARVGELAENVPGLVATQHSGTGKANQYFLRGFNLDHGTDLAGFVDGVPVNMRSHGHGQGYLDLNFLIPETIERIDYTKGPYHAELGDFASAGSMAFRTRTAFERPFVEATAGSFGYARLLAAGSGSLGGGTLLAAVEGVRTNGPWVLDEDLEKLNALVKFSTADWSLAASGYTSRWTSTDQVPERAIETGLIPRNGFIDPDTGGRAGRAALTFNGRFGDTEVTAFALASRLRLTSNFTYFLDDPVNGDEFGQADRRGVIGGALRHEARGNVFALPLIVRLGGDARFDRIGRLGLYRTVGTAIRETVREDRVDEYGGGLFGEAELALARGLRLVLGLRGDAIGYRVRSDLAVNSGSGSAGIVTPKAALAWSPAAGIELYANYGEGFHSNDVRGATITTDPASGDPADPVPVFARSRGAEFGGRVESGGFTASVAAFRLDLASELVFVGDAGTTEPNDATRREGVEAAVFWRAADVVTFDGTLAYTHARFRGAGAADRIPGAVPLVASAGISVAPAPGLALTARLRHFGAAPLIENNSRRSDATSLVNLGVYHERGRLRLAAELLNSFDAEAPDISYFYASRLPAEPDDGIEDRHIHPVEPRQLRASLRLTL